MSAMGYYMTAQYLAAGAGVVPLGITSFANIAKAFETFPVTMVATLPIVASRLSEFLAYKSKEITFQKQLRQFHFGGDYLSNARRSRIEEYWKVDCFDFYGLSEIFGPIAGECPKKDGLHLAADYILTEVIDPETKRPVSNGEIGVAVYTTLWDKGAPLLRFWSDDYVIPTHERCRCGRTSPRIYYKGRPSNMLTIKGKRIFIKDIEETLLFHPEVGNEWGMKISGTLEQPEAILYIERRPQKRISAGVLRKVRHELSEQIGIPIEVEDVPFATFPRKNLKPARINDFREPTKKHYDL
jgi:phenylacetate-CoA ligase